MLYMHLPDHLEQVCQHSSKRLPHCLLFSLKYVNFGMNEKIMNKRQVLVQVLLSLKLLAHKLNQQDIM